MPRKSDYDWTKEKLDRLRAQGSLIQHIQPDVVYEEGPWTVLKLLALHMLHGVYLPIMHGQQEKGRIGKLLYIDLNAGAGLVRVEGTPSVMAGSALIGANIHRIHEHEGYKYDYDHFVFVEPDPIRAGALRERLLAWLPESRFTLFESGVDEAMDEILPMIDPERNHYLCVFDPYGFRQGTWKSYGRLLESTGRGDILINFQTTSVKRTSEENRSAFFGPHYPGGYSDLSEEELLHSFKHDCLRPYRPITNHVRIRGSRGFRYYYDMVYAVARTQGGNPFMKAFQDIERRVSKLTGDDVKRMLGHESLERWFT